MYRQRPSIVAKWASMELRVLGGFSFRSADDDARGPSGLKPRLLLVYLALAGDRGASRGELAELLWSASAREAARQSLRQALSDLRRHLGPEARGASAETKSRRALEALARLLDLPPLERAEAEALALLLTDGDRAMARECARHSAGHPWTIEQLAWEATSGGSDVSAAARDLLEERFGRLESRDRRALEAAAILGPSTSLARLRALIGDPVYDPSPLFERNWLEPTPEGVGFRHDLTRRAVEDLTPESTRRALRTAADLAGDDAPANRAAHLERAGDPEAALAYLAAAREALERYQPAEAWDLLDRAAGQAEARHLTPIELLRGRVAIDLGRWVAARTSFDRAAQTDRPELRAEALIGRAEVARLTDALDAAFASLDEAEAASVAAPDPHRTARIHHLRGNLLFGCGRWDRVRKEHDAALRWATKTGDLELQAAALTGLGDVHYMRGRMTQAKAAFRKARPRRGGRPLRDEGPRRVPALRPRSPDSRARARQPAPRARPLRLPGPDRPPPGSRRRGASAPRRSSPRWSGHQPRLLRARRVLSRPAAGAPSSFVV